MMYTKVCRNLVYILYTYFINVVYISCIHLAQFLHTKFIHSSLVGSYKITHIEAQLASFFRLCSSFHSIRCT